MKTNDVDRDEIVKQAIFDDIIELRGQLDKMENMINIMESPKSVEYTDVCAYLKAAETVAHYYCGNDWERQLHDRD